jgi:ppGpp synthetase/RelA/SpoT-type nucleotidyltranferase
VANFSRGSLREDFMREIAKHTIFPERLDDSFDLAYKAHDGQKRDAREGGAVALPYIIHPIGVAKSVAEFYSTVEVPDSIEDIISAALLHDVLEDSPVTKYELLEVTSARVVEIVSALTKPQLPNSMSRETRNLEFQRRIIRGGATCCFIKVCDAMNNLSQLRSMPDSLLEKTIAKAHQQYLPLLDYLPRSDDLKVRFEQYISNAMNELRLRNVDNAILPFLTIDEALEYAISKTHGKILEDHDIKKVIERVSGISGAFLGTVDEYLRMDVKRYCTKLNQQREAVIRKHLLAGEVKLEQFGDIDSTIEGGSFHSILSAPLEGADGAISKNRLFLKLVGDHPAWLTRTALLALVAVLSSRNREKAAAKISTLADEINTLGLMLNTNLALNAKLTYADLIDLKSNEEAASFILQTVLTNLRASIDKSEFSQIVDRWESRVKASSSIVRKMIARNWPSLDKFDDLVGIRLIVLSRKDRDALCVWMIDLLNTYAKQISPVIQLVEDSVEVDEIKSDAGYLASHITFKVVSPLTTRSPVSCEIQIRTLFEDSWARASQLTSYKKSATSSSSLKELEKLAKLREACDEVTNRLSQEVNFLSARGGRGNEVV